MQLANAMIVGLQELDVNINHLQMMKTSIVLDFARELTSEYNVLKGDSATLCSERLGSDVEEILKYRKALRRVVRDTPGASLDALQPASVSSGCVIS